MSWNILFLLSCSFIVASANAQLRIYQGNTTKISDYPHQVSIRIGSFLLCGGSIIDARHILTAAHCIVDLDYQPHQGVLIHAGVSSIRSKGNVYEIADYIIHPGYKLDSEKITAVNDVGLFKLKTPIRFDRRQKAIPLPTQNAVNGASGTIIGWGKTEMGVPANVLQKLDVTVMTAKTCQPYLLSKIYETQICADHGDGRGACHGDSGGPLIVNGVIVGIASWVEKDICASQWPDVYTNVYAFLDFINSYVNKRSY